MVQKSLFYLKRQWASLCWKCELFEGAEAVGQPVLTLRNGCGLPRCTQSTRLTTATGEPVAELKSHAYVGIKHSFVIDNRRYLWKRTSGWFARRPRSFPLLLHCQTCNFKQQYVESPVASQLLWEGGLKVLQT